MIRARKRSSFTSLAAVATAGYALAVGAATAGAGDAGGTATYQYKVTDFTYDAHGQLTGGRFKGLCVPNVNAAWQGTVTTAESDVNDLNHGTGSLKIGEKGSTGAIAAQTKTTSNLTNSFHRITTACDEDGNETAYKMTVCQAPYESQEQASVRISGGVGDSVTVVWRFANKNNLNGGHLVPDVYKCIEPLKFPNAVFKSTVPLSKFTRKHVTLPFKVFAATTKPPSGTDYTQYESNVSAKGSITLTRTKQRN
jgi:hypothetical protein